MSALPIVQDARELQAYATEHPAGHARLHLRAPTEEIFEALVALGDALACVAELHLEDATLDDPGTQPHAAAFFKSRWLTGVRAVTLTGGTIFAIFEMTYVVNLFARNDALSGCTSFTVERCQIGYDAWTTLVLGTWWSGLTHLSIRQADLDDRTIDPVVLWTPLPHAQHVAIHSDTLTDWGVETRIAIAKWPETLTTLEVQGALLTKTAWEHLATCEALSEAIRASYRARADASDDSWEARFGELRAQLQDGLHEPHARTMLLERLRQFHDEDRARYRAVVIPYLEGIPDISWPDPFWVEYRDRPLTLNRAVRLLPFVSLGLIIPDYDETFHLNWSKLAQASSLRHVRAIWLGGDHGIDAEDLSEVLDGDHGGDVTSWGFDDPQDQEEVEDELEARGLHVIDPAVFVKQAFGRTL